MKPLWQGWMRAQFSFRVLAGAMALMAASAGAAAQATPWDKPAADLAARIAEALGPGPVRFTLTNLSAIPAEQLPTIRRLLEGDLRSGGISFGGADAANALRVTLSENQAGGLWVAEVAEGSQAHVLMVAVDPAPDAHPVAKAGITLHRDVIARGEDLLWNASPKGAPASAQILAFAQVNGGVVVLTPVRIGVFTKSAQGWSEQSHADLGALHSASRDPRGTIVPSADGFAFDAFAPGVTCIGSLAAGASSWTTHCHAGDDPWPLIETAPGQWIKAFYNAGRDSFTGVVTVAGGAAYPPFYNAGLLPGRPGGAAVLISAIDGKIALADSGQVKAVAGTRDWGSDFAVVAPGCGASAQVIVSSSGDGNGDSLRAFELPSLEAMPVSDALMLNGAAMALWPAPDGKSALVIVRAAQPGRDWTYEVDRVSEACN